MWGLETIRWMNDREQNPALAQKEQDRLSRLAGELRLLANLCDKQAKDLGQFVATKLAGQPTRYPDGGLL